MHIRICILVLALAGCGKLGPRHPASPSSSPAAPALKAESDHRMADLVEKTKDRAGWPSVTDCDGTVWAGVAFLAGAPVDWTLAEYPSGVLERRPHDPNGPCWVEGKADPQESASTASGDDLVLYAAAAFKAKDVGTLGRLLDHAAADGGYIGVPHKVDLTYLLPIRAGILARAVKVLGGQTRPEDRDPVLELPPGKDYQVHVETEEILFASAVAGQASTWEVALLSTMALANPNDALVEAALGVYTGDCVVAPGLLLNPATPVPSYVRGDQAALFAEAWWLRAASLVLSHCKE